ncbi:hypothetical protein [Duganella sp. P38]|uniref:hypothetical protein n=1 Tax=Duganella sp. P38 TaxID=3423949 RepID=UPI003D7AD92D
MTVVLTPERALAASVMMLSCCAALAGEEAAAPRWTLGGFGTLALAHSNNEQADFSANMLSPGAVGYSGAWSAKVDSRAGAQLDLNLERDWAAVLQVVFKRTPRGYAPTVEWANIQYRVTPDLSVRAGRTTMPLFLSGDYGQVGYALPWVRPPVEVYGAIPPSSSDGVDASYRWQMGDINNVTQLLYGRTDIPASSRARVRAHGLAGVSNTSTSGALTVRASLLHSHLSVDVANPLFDGLRQFGEQGAALVRRYEVAHKHVRVMTASLSYDPGNWFMMAEIGRMQADSYLGDKTAGYLSAGYRYRALTPYLLYSRSRPNGATTMAGLDLDAVPAQRAPAGAALNAGLNRLLAAIPRQHTVGAGLRWDLRPDYALKLQYDRITPEPGSTGTFINVQPGFRAGQPVTVLTAALDLVF